MYTLKRTRAAYVYTLISAAAFALIIGCMSFSAVAHAALDPTALIGICHTTRAESGLYTPLLETAENIISDHDQHSGDIIPSFDYDFGSASGTYPGKNLGGGGQEILDNHCVVSEGSSDGNNDDGDDTDGGDNGDSDNGGGTDDTGNGDGGGSNGGDGGSDDGGSIGKSGGGGGEKIELTEKSDEDGESEGEVLGEATSACGMYLFDYMREGFGAGNKAFEVMKLQAFLNGQGYAVPMSGTFDAATTDAVRTFQSVHTSDILQPWVAAGFMTEPRPTGYVYKTTRWFINNMICPGSEAFPYIAEG